MSELLKELYRTTVYAVKGLVWRPRSLHEDVLNDRLSRYCLNLGNLNQEFDNNEVHPSVGRFPKILREYSDLTFILISSIDEFEHLNSNKQITLEEKRLLLANYLSKRALEKISEDPKAFKRIFDSTGFYK